MDRRAVAKSDNLIKNIAELQLKLILCHETNMRRCDYIWMGRKRVIGPGDRLFIKHIEGRGSWSPAVQRVKKCVFLNKPCA